MTAAIAGVTDTAQQTSTAAPTTAAQDIENRFLKLLVTQMKNQDPLNPLDNAQITSQMAQLSTVSGIEKLNATLQTFTQTQAFQAVGMIGHSVLAPGNFIDLQNGVGVGGLDLPQAADKVVVSVINSSGQVVQQMDLGKKDAGVSVFSWNGMAADGTTAPDGAYTFKVDASQGGNTITPTSLAVGQVSSVLMDQTGPSLSVTGMGLVGLSAVRQIL